MSSSYNDDNEDTELDRFVVEALETGCVFGLESEEGWALCPSEKYPNSDVMPLWSDRVAAQSQCRDEWGDYQAIPIALDELLDDWLPGMHEDELLVGVNWNQELEGEELEPLDLLAEFEQEL